MSENLAPETAAALAELFSAFSDPSRLRIIATLAGGELSVRTIAEAVGLTESATSHQLRGLRDMHLVRTRKQGRQVFYSLDDEHILNIYQVGLEHIQHARTN